MTKIMRYYALVFSLLSFPLLGADSHVQADDSRLQLGMNLAGPTDYNAEWPFVNIMKYGRTWETTNAGWTGGAEPLEYRIT